MKSPQRYVFYALMFWGVIYSMADCAEKTSADVDETERLSWEEWARVVGHTENEIAGYGYLDHDTDAGIDEPAPVVFDDARGIIPIEPVGECWPVWDAESKQNLGRCIHAEAQTRRSDWAPMAWVLVKLWVTTRRTQGWTINDQITRYCGMFKNKGKRPTAIRASTWDNPVHGKQREWDTIRTFVEEFAAGNVGDPLPLADHWNGINDEPRPNWDMICTEPLTANNFYRSY